MDTSSAVIFIILAFTLGTVLLMKRDSIPAPLKKWMALAAVIMICFAFFLIIYGLMLGGSN
ncbi:hypothetical protein OIN60_13310 [Paenibacillus sp. P96]|uniref:Signal transduction histidine kinase n=1 Tax=Paenibacillus zeirhizosphaerae TaxID=2987519 RepID=A0ABT9FSV4_9BACL|nr:hypothetical protein [Paenibacillus sp. P96]MDP4097749.1 hypothetical protein [Paenibacillus sp. P96]